MSRWRRICRFWRYFVARCFKQTARFCYWVTREREIRQTKTKNRNGKNKARWERRGRKKRCVNCCMKWVRVSHLAKIGSSEVISCDHSFYFFSYRSCKDACRKLPFLPSLYREQEREGDVSEFRVLSGTKKYMYIYIYGKTELLRHTPKPLHVEKKISRARSCVWKREEIEIRRHNTRIRKWERGTRMKLEDWTRIWTLTLRRERSRYITYVQKSFITGRKTRLFLEGFWIWVFVIFHVVLLFPREISRWCTSR